MRKILEETKIKQGRGTGSGADYKPWIYTTEQNSQGTCSTPIDWITGRTVELLSQGEDMVWHILRFDEEVTDIREQFPLDNEIVKKICADYNIRVPRSTMTTDFLVTFKSGFNAAYSIKNSRSDFSKINKSDKAIRKIDRTLEKLQIEKLYWENYKNTHYQIIFKDEINTVYYQNIRAVCEYYDLNTVHDKISAIKHMIATKQLKVDMKNKLIDFNKLSKTITNIRKKGETNYE